MTTHTLLTRIYNPRQLRQIEDMLKLPFEGLDVEAKVVGIAVNRWVQLDVSGEDEAIATNYLAKEFGFCPTAFENVQKNAALKGHIAELGKSSEELLVDVGVFQPTTVPAVIPLRHLQAELVDGRKLTLKEIGELFGFYEDLPVSVKITAVDKAENHLEAELSTMQVEKYVSWQESLLDRLIVLGSSLHEIKRTLDYTGLNRDIIAVEHLGTFEHALTCKLGTDAAGLISKIGRNLRNARFTVFNPRKIRQFLKLAPSPCMNE
jgi:hypothetical protein